MLQLQQDISVSIILCHCDVEKQRASIRTLCCFSLARSTARICSRCIYMAIHLE
ncbi:hypothetical protein M3J09_004582 [Ascochyta lentis]